MNHPASKKNLLIIHQGALGDLVVAFPAVRRLKKGFDQIDVVCQNSLGKLACAIGVFSKCFPIETASFASLYSAHIDSGIKDILHSYQEIVLFSYSEQLERVITEITNKRPHRIIPRPEADQKIHVTRHIAYHLRKCGLLKTDTGMDEAGFLSGHSGDQIKRIYESKRILIHPGSGSKKKFWPLLNFIKTETALRSDGLKPEFILGPAELFLVEAIRANGYQNSRINIVSEPGELLLSLQTAGGFIGNDSGITHLAAFSGLPTVAVFGPSDPERWRPVGRSVEIVRPDLGCNPCFEKAQPCTEMECFNRTTPEMVVNAFYAGRKKLKS
jgi:heptosyltransferase-3